MQNVPPSPANPAVAGRSTGRSSPRGFRDRKGAVRPGAWAGEGQRVEGPGSALGSALGHLGRTEEGVGPSKIGQCHAGTGQRHRKRKKSDAKSQALLPCTDSESHHPARAV